MKQYNKTNYYYNKVVSDELDAPIYELYKSVMGVLVLVNEFGSYNDMRYYIKTGKYL